MKVLVIACVLLSGCSFPKPMSNEEIAKQSEFCTAHGLSWSFMYSDGLTMTPVAVVCVHKVQQ